MSGPATVMYIHTGQAKFYFALTFTWFRELHCIIVNILF